MTLFYNTSDANLSLCLKNIWSFKMSIIIIKTNFFTHFQILKKIQYSHHICKTKKWFFLD